jgi:hypothetical protein
MHGTHDFAPGREYDAYMPTRAADDSGNLQRLNVIREHTADGETWHTNALAKLEYAADDAKRREAEARQKPVPERPWDPFGTDLGDPGAISARYVRDRADYVEGKLAGIDDAYLPKAEGGDGRRNPMDADALQAREERELQAIRKIKGDKFAQDAGKRVTTWGERYHKPIGAPTVRIIRDKRGGEHAGKRYLITGDGAMRRPLRGVNATRRQWARPTENEAIRAIVDDDTNGVTITMTRGMLKLWKQVHDVQVQRGKLNDANLSAILTDAVARTKPGETRTFVVRDRATLRKFRGAPKRFRKGPFGEFLDYITRL